MWSGEEYVLWLSTAGAVPRLLEVVTPSPLSVGCTLVRLTRIDDGNIGDGDEISYEEELDFNLTASICLRNI